MNVLMMGGSVFVGRSLLKGLVREGHSVVAVTRGLQPANWEGVDHVECDRRDTQALRLALAGRHFDVVVDASCCTALDTTALLDALASPAEAIVMISSAAVYNRNRNTFPFQENGAAGGDAIWGDYGTSKHEAELALTQHQNSPRHHFILRPPYIYGPGNNLDREQFFWARLDATEPILVPGNGETLVQMCHIDDLADIVCKLVGHDRPESGAYNVGDPQFFSFNQLILLLASLSAKDPLLTYVHDLSISARRYFPFRNNHLILDTTKAIYAGFTFRSLQNGMESTYASRTVGSADIERSAIEQELLKTMVNP